MLNDALYESNPAKSLQSWNKMFDKIEHDNYPEPLHELTFSDREFDVRELFSSLVEKLGHKTVINPVTKEDAVWRTIDYFTKMGTASSLFNPLNEKDIALYFKNHSDNTLNFERMTSVILRAGDGSSVHTHLLQFLKEYQAQHKTMPLSFTDTKIRNSYIKLRNANKHNQYKMSTRAAEYFLYLFRSNKMWGEIIDLCENYETLTGVKIGQADEIKNYYLSDALI
jgi:hypothetical protein